MPFRWISCCEDTFETDAAQHQDIKLSSEALQCLFTFTPPPTNLFSSTEKLWRMDEISYYSEKFKDHVKITKSLLFFKSTR